MKTGRTLTELAQELERQVHSKKDYLADTRRLAMTETDNSLLLHNGNKENYPMTNLCHNQVAARLNIPRKYYDLMREKSPRLLSTNVNHWLNNNPERRLIRTLDGRARAFLSERFRPLDNYDLAEAILPKLNEIKCQVMSAELTETRLYIKAVTPRIQREVQKDDIVQAGIVISNSEVGCGSVKVEPMIFRLVCLNGAIMADSGLRKYHIGKYSGDLEDNALEFFRDETRKIDDKAFWMKVQDVVVGSFNAKKFERIVNRWQESIGKKIEGNPVEAVEVLSKHFMFADSEKGSVINHLIAGKELSAYGLANAVTRASQDVESYDRATELERMGGDVIELPSNVWNKVATAN